MKSVYHLDLDEKKVNGAKIAIIPGDPARVAHIAKFIDDGKHAATKREFTSYTGFISNTPVIITSTGIGGPSTSICVDELAQLGVNTFIRVGTTGAIQEHINLGDVIVSTASVRLDGASFHFAPPEYPAVADFHVTSALLESAKENGLKAHLGITASSDTFYQGQERYDSYSQYVPRNLQGSMKEWQKLNVLNYEMESATLFTMCAAMGLKAGCVAGVIVNRTKTETPDKTMLSRAEDNITKISISTIKRLIEKR